MASLLPIESVGLRRRGEALLYGIFGVALAGVLVLAVCAPHLVWVVPVGLVGLCVAGATLRSERAFYIAATGGFIVNAAYGEGFRVEEVLYGLFYLSYLVCWIGSRLMVQPRSLFQSRADIALFFFLVWSTLSISWSLAFGAVPERLVTDWIAVSMLAFFFPTREIVRRYPNGARIVVGVLIFLGLAVALRNLLNYQSLLLSATMLWQFSVRRVVTNEVLLLIPSIATLMLAVYAHRRAARIVSIAAFAPLFVSLVITQSRGYWVDFVLACMVMPMLMHRKYRWRFIWLGVIGFSTVVAFAAIFLGDLLNLIVGALLDRFLTLQTAVQSDLSLRSRFFEARAVWDMIEQNPVIGYGLGVPFTLYDIIADVTRDRTYIHNGYVGLLYKAGIVGTLPILYAWAHYIWQAWRVSRLRSWAHPLGVFLTAGLISIIPSASTAHQFYSPDISLTFALMAGCAVGLFERSREASDALEKTTHS